MDGNNSQIVDSKNPHSKEYWRMMQNRAQSNINSQRKTINEKSPP